MNSGLISSKNSGETKNIENESELKKRKLENNVNLLDFNVSESLKEESRDARTQDPRAECGGDFYS